MTIAKVEEKPKCRFCGCEHGWFVKAGDQYVCEDCVELVEAALLASLPNLLRELGDFLEKAWTYITKDRTDLKEDIGVTEINLLEMESKTFLKTETAQKKLKVSLSHRNLQGHD